MDGKSRNGKLYVNLKLIKFKKLSILGYSRKKKQKKQGGGRGSWGYGISRGIEEITSGISRG